MIKRDVARKLLMRLRGKRNFPSAEENDDLISALIDAVQRYAVDDAHAKRFIDEIDEQMEFCPDISSIRRFALATRPERKIPDCPRCKGTGFAEKVVRRRRLPGVEAPPTVTCVEPCSCRDTQAVVEEYVSEGLGV